MAQTMWKPALALAAVLAISGLAQAADPAPAKSGFGGTTMTLGGKGTIADAVSAGDTELTHGRYFYGGYGGYGHYHGGYYHGGYYGHYYGYRPYYYPAYRPVYPVYPVVTPYYYGGGIRIYGGYGGFGFYGRINGDNADAVTPAVALGSGTPAQAPLAQPRAFPAPAPQPDGTFKYDGGPANPIPPVAPGSPATQPAPIPVIPPGGNDLPVSLKNKPPVKPSPYKAYGEK
jgi:hypothetical protein